MVIPIKYFLNKIHVLETILTDYKRSVHVVFDYYIQLFYSEYTENMAWQTVQNFLLKHNDNYRKEINDIAVFAISNHNFNQETIDKIIALNDVNVVKLRDKIMDSFREQQQNAVCSV